jgi:hypothetical protein
MEEANIEDGRLANLALVLDSLGIAVVEVDVATRAAEKKTGQLAVYSHLVYADAVVCFRVH